MSPVVAGWIVAALEVYAGIGLLFAMAFVVAGVNRVDAVARRSGWGFRLMILPGSAAIWPVLLRRWIRSLPPPVERTAHRRAAGHLPAAPGGGAATGLPIGGHSRTHGHESGAPLNPASGAGR